MPTYKIVEEEDGDILEILELKTKRYHVPTLIVKRNDLNKLIAEADKLKD